jgi:hypothetical protein
LENNIKPDAFFCIDNKPMILFFENPPDVKKLHKNIWNFNETPIVIIVNNDNIEIFNGFKLVESGIDKGYLEKMKNQELNDFSYFKLVTGKTWENYEKELSYKNRIDYKLLDNIGAAREQILEQFPLKKTNNEKTKKRHIKITNALLGKVIFVRYLIDRKVKIYFDNESKERTNEDFCTILSQPDRARQFFDILADKDVGFNGDLFCLEDDEYQKIPQKAFDVLIKLLKSQEISTGQQSLFDLYDFSIIPIEFISNVYEYFIGSENQAEQSAYYTPLFLVDYILSETIEKHFANNSKTNDCKTLDPACGSGIFLVETLRKIIEQYQKNNGNKLLTPDTLKKLVIENIYGIDKDPSAIQVAMFSIYLTLLDYQKSADIETFKFPCLLNSNFFEADFFNTNIFETKLQNVDFDFIVGNPPWKGGALGELGKIYIKERKIKDSAKKKKYSAAINNNEIVEGFVLRVSDFSKPKTNCALIVRSSILYNNGYNADYSGFRRYWLEEYFVNKIVEFATEINFQKRSKHANLEAWKG